MAKLIEAAAMEEVAEFMAALTDFLVVQGFRLIKRDQPEDEGDQDPALKE